MRRPLLSLLLAGLTGCNAGCNAGGVVGPRPAATRKPTATRTATPAPRPVTGLQPVVVPQAGVTAVALTGKAKIISDNGGGIISDNGGGLIAASKGRIISDNGGGVISNNSGGIVANNGAGYRLAQQASGLAVYALAQAAVTLEDAAGRPLVDEAGKPLGGTTGADGGYRIAAALPPGNVVAKVRLWNGGELAAMVVRDGAASLALDLDTASTMGAAYVLGQYVKGDQAVFDKLPRAEAERLTRELDVVRGYLTGTFKYDAGLLTEATDALRAREATLDRTLEDVKALLLGQARIGAGRLATEVALGTPAGLLVDAQGRLLIGESFTGRIRAVGADGRLETLADSAFGTVKRNFLGLADMIALPGGGLLVASDRSHQVFAITADGQVSVFAGTAVMGRGPLKTPTDTDMVPGRLARGADGTVYIGEYQGLKSPAPGARVYAVSPAGALSLVAVPDWGVGPNVLGLEAGPAGELYALHGVAGVAGSATLWQLLPGPPRTVATSLSPGGAAKLRRRADGKLLLAEEGNHRVVAIDPATGAVEAIAGAGGPAATAAIRTPTLCWPAADALYVADIGGNLIWKVPADGGAAVVVAGTQAAIQQGDLTSFAINTPGGAVFDDRNRLYIADGGSHTVKRFTGAALEVFAGTVQGFGGDGGPATQARLDSPTGVFWRDGGLWIIDGDNRRLRFVAPDGTITTRSGAAAPIEGATETVAPGATTSGSTFSWFNAVAMALDPQQRPVVVSSAQHQIYRYDPATDLVTGLVGKIQAFDGVTPPVFGDTNPDPAAAALSFPLALAFDPTAAAPTLCFSEATAFQIRRVTGLDGPDARLGVLAGMSLTDGLLQIAANPDMPPPDENGIQATRAFLAVPTGIAFDAQGRLYVAEAGTQALPSLAPLAGGSLPLPADVIASLPVLPARVRRIDKDGTIHTIAGPGGRYFTDPTAEDALVLPTALAIAPDGRLAIVDTGANLVRILPAAGISN